jgi:antitoxin HicB
MKLLFQSAVPLTEPHESIVVHLAKTPDKAVSTESVLQEPGEDQTFTSAYALRYTVVLEREGDGGYVATVPALPGCVSQGDTRDEVTKNIREAADLYIEDCIAAGDPVPTEAGREYFELTTTGPR